MIENTIIQSPLRYDELIGCNRPVWLEQNNDDYICNDGWCMIKRHNGICNTIILWFGNEVEDIGYDELYGKTWRCWFDKPTAIEKKVAKWK